MHSRIFAKFAKLLFLLNFGGKSVKIFFLASRNLFFKTNTYILSKQNMHIWVYIRFSGRTPCQSWTGLRYQILMLRAKFWGQINDVINYIIFTTFIQKWSQYNHIGTCCSPIHRFSFNKFQNIFSTPLPRLIDPPPTIRSLKYVKLGGIFTIKAYIFKDFEVFRQIREMFRVFVTGENFFPRNF